MFVFLAVCDKSFPVVVVVVVVVVVENIGKYRKKIGKIWKNKGKIKDQNPKFEKKAAGRPQREAPRRFFFKF